MSVVDLAVILRLDDKLSAPAKKAAEALRSITKAAADLKKIGGGLDILPAKIKESSAGMRALSSDVRSFSSAFRSAADSARSMSREMAANRGKSWMADEVKNLRAMVELQGKLASGQRFRGGVHGSLLGVSLFGGHPHLRSEGRAGWDEASAVRHQMTLLQTLGMNQADMAEAYKKAVQVSNEIQTATISQSLQTYREMRQAFLHPKEAVEHLGALVKADAIFNAISESKPGMRGMHWREQAYDFAKAIEMMGVTNPKQFEDYLGGMVQAMGAFGGKIQGRDFHGNIKYARSAAQNWSKEFVTQVLPTLIQEYKVGGGSGAGGSAGTGLMSLFEVVSTGTMKEEAAKRWVGLGLAKSSDITKSGLRPGAIAGNHLFQADPYQWAWQVLVPAMVRKGIITSDDVDAIKRGDTKDKEFAKNITKFIAGLGGTRTARDALTKLILQQARIERDRQNILETMDFKAWDTLSKGSPTVALQAFATQLKGFIASLMDPLMPAATKVLAGLGSALSSLMKAMRDNPGLNASVTGLVLGGGALLLPRVLRSMTAGILLGGGVGLMLGDPLTGVIGGIIGAALTGGVSQAATSAGPTMAAILVKGLLRGLLMANIWAMVLDLVGKNLNPETRKQIDQSYDDEKNPLSWKKTGEFFKRLFGGGDGVSVPLPPRDPRKAALADRMKEDGAQAGSFWTRSFLDTVRSILSGAVVDGPKIGPPLLDAPLPTPQNYIAPSRPGGVGHASLQFNGGIHIAVNGGSDPHATADAVYRKFNMAVNRQLSDGAFAFG